MEHKLRCNALKCRKELGDQALVTTCRLDVVAPDGSCEPGRSCPACNTALTNRDDAVVANLNPSEDYKTSILSGLSPNIIVECASRALSFWAYQATQEVIYQEYLGKTLTEKYTNLTMHLDSVVNEANSQIGALQNRLTSLNADQENLRKNHEELTQLYKNKSRKLLQTTELYDKLKRKALMGSIQDAAEDAADMTLQASHEAIAASGQGHASVINQQYNGQQQSTPLPPNHQMRPAAIPRASNMYVGQGPSQAPGSGWPRSTATEFNLPFTPSTHRYRVGETGRLGPPAVPGLVNRPGASPRGPMGTRLPPGGGSLDPRSDTHFPSIGLRSGMRAGNGGGVMSAEPRPIPSTPIIPHDSSYSFAGHLRSGSISRNMRSGFDMR